MDAIIFISLTQKNLGLYVCKWGYLKFNYYPCSVITEFYCGINNRTVSTILILTVVPHIVGLISMNCLGVVKMYEEWINTESSSGLKLKILKRTLHGNISYPFFFSSWDKLAPVLYIATLMLSVKPHSQIEQGVLLFWSPHYVLATILISAGLSIILKTLKNGMAKQKYSSFSPKLHGTWQTFQRRFHAQIQHLNKL